MIHNKQSQEEINIEKRRYGENEILVLLEKYFPHLPYIVIVFKPENIDIYQLKDILKKYKLSLYFELFKDLAMWMPKILEIDKNADNLSKEYQDKLKEWNHLVQIAEGMKNNTFSYIEIKPKGRTGIKIISKEIQEVIGNLILEKFNKDQIGINKVTKLKELVDKNLGRPKMEYNLAAICNILKNILNNETSLKSEDKVISNEQASLIYDLLVFIEIPNLALTIKSVGCDYVRTLLNNHKNDDLRLKWFEE